MSARSDLMLRLGMVAGSYSPQRDGELIDALLRDHAHELAERQRGFAEQEDAHLRSTSATVYVQGIRDAADLIDPEVST